MVKIQFWSLSYVSNFNFVPKLLIVSTVIQVLKMLNYYPYLPHHHYANLNYWCDVGPYIGLVKSEFMETRDTNIRHHDIFYLIFLYINLLVSLHIFWFCDMRMQQNIQCQYCSDMYTKKIKKGKGKDCHISYLHSVGKAGKG